MKLSTQVKKIVETYFGQKFNHYWENPQENGFNNRKELLALPLLHVTKYFVSAEGFSAKFTLCDKSSFGYTVSHVDIADEKLFFKHLLMAAKHFSSNYKFDSLKPLKHSLSDAVMFFASDYENANIDFSVIDSAFEMTELLINSFSSYSTDTTNSSDSQAIINKKELKTKQRKNYCFSELLEKGDEAVQDLLTQLSWVVAAESVKSDKLTSGLLPVAKPIKPGHNSPITYESIETVNLTLFLTALLGSTSALARIGKAGGLCHFEIKFPKEIYNKRKELMGIVTNKTFETTYQNQRLESDWFTRAERYKKDLTFEFEIITLFNQILLEKKDKTLVIDFDDLSELLLSSEMTTNFAPFLGEQATVMEEFVELNQSISNNKPYKYNALNKIKAHLNNAVLGQIEAIDAVCNHLSTILLNEPKQHLGVSTFLGESGSGKTFLAENIAECFNSILDLGYQSTVFHMEQYTEEADVMKLLGAGSQYISASLGDLTSTVMKHPRQIIVLDESEKAHPAVIQALLTPIDKGTAQDRTLLKDVDFSQCYFIFTTNLGSKAVSEFFNKGIPLNVIELLTDKKQSNSLSHEMGNRLNAGNIAAFQNISAKNLVKLAMNQCKQTEEHSQVNWESNCPELILKTLGNAVSPRSINTQLDTLNSQLINDTMALLSENDYYKLENIAVSGDSIDTIEQHHITIFSKDLELMDKLNNPLLRVCDINDIAEIEKELNKPAAAYLFDEQFLNVDLKALAHLFKSHADKVMVSYNAEGHISQLEKCSLPSTLYRNFSSQRRDIKSIQYVNSQLNRHLTLINSTDEMIRRGKKVSYKTSISLTNNGAIAHFNDFKYTYELRQDDLALPFLKFDGVPELSFKDVVGLDEAKQRLKLIANGMKNPDSLTGRHLEIPKGYLLSGLPGSGKTFLAKALAGECGMSFFNVNAADLLVGNPVGNVNKLFDVLKRYAPSILFLDEIDSIAQNRVNSNGASTLAVNSLLTAIDGFSKSVLPVFVLAATNHPQLLDPALLRSGRLEKNIYCDVPNAEEREVCLIKQLEKANGIITPKDLSDVVSMTSGCTIAVLEQVVRESFYNEIQSGQPWSGEMLVEELRKAKFGNIRTDLVQTKENLRATAFHEAGHLVAHKLLLPTLNVEYATIQPRGAALGMIVPGENNERNQITKGGVKNYLQVLLAGMASEHLLGFTGDKQSSGASDDRMKATNLAKKAIMEWGMSDKFGLAIPSAFNQSEQIIFTEVNEWLIEAFDEVKSLLSSHRHVLNGVTDALVERESLEKVEINTLFTELMNAGKLELVS